MSVFHSLGRRMGELGVCSQLSPFTRPGSPERRGIKITKLIHSNPQSSIPSSGMFQVPTTFLALGLWGTMFPSKI